jgi:N-dimethylarginine dimethylaminohydrolase
MNSHNEWGTLKKVIVGVADHAVVPKVDKSVRLINYADTADIAQIPIGAYPQQVIDEANQDLEIFVDFLRGESVEVLRPTRTPTDYYNFCPRDVVLIHDDLALATPMPLRCRKDAWQPLINCIENLEVTKCLYQDELYNDQCLGDPDILALTEVTPAFDAANIIRANDHVLYLVSNSANVAGAELLQKKLSNRAAVHLLQGVYSYMHIDSTVAFLREGLLLLNPERIKDVKMLPAPFDTWDVIWCPEPEDIGYYANYKHASKWVANMNLFSVNPNLVVLEQHQEPTRRVLEKHGIECAMLPMRHQRTLSGGFHCVTLDLDRADE